jgi:putative transposase
MRRIERYFPLSHGIARVDDRRIVSAIVFVIKNGLRWRDAPRDYGPHKTISNRFFRWSRLGVFNRIFAELARKGGKPERIMIDATHLKAHRTAASLLKKGLFPDKQYQAPLHRLLGSVHFIWSFSETAHAPRIYLPMTLARARCHQPLRRGRGGSGSDGADAEVSAATSASAIAKESTVGSALVACSSISGSSASATGDGRSGVSSSGTTPSGDGEGK